MTVHLTFDFDIQLLHSLKKKKKESRWYGDHSDPISIEIGTVILKLSKFLQVQGECKWTLVA